MMHGKALLFDDEETANKILNQSNNNPRTIKALGRQVRGFKDHVWKQNRYDIVYRNNGYCIN